MSNGPECNDRLGPSIGKYRDRDIPAFVRIGDGRIGHFAGVAPLSADGSIDLEKVLRDDEFLVYPGLVYRMEEGI